MAISCLSSPISIKYSLNRPLTEELMLSNTIIDVVPKDSEKSLPNLIEQVSKNIIFYRGKRVNEKTHVYKNDA
jgi:hypothetical protein